MVRSMAGDVASKAADKLQPTEDQMSQIDAPAEENTWHEAPKTPEMSRQKIQEQLKSIRGRTPFGKKGGNDGSISDGAIAVQQKEALNVEPATGTEVTPKAERDTKKKWKEYQSRSQNYLGRKMPKERREQTIWRLKKMVGASLMLLQTNVTQVVEIQGHADCMLSVRVTSWLTSRRPRSRRDLASPCRRVRWPR